MKKICCLIYLITLINCAGPAAITTEPKYSSKPTEKIVTKQIVELETRKYKYDTIKQKFIFIKPTNPVASIILFEGRGGSLDLTEKAGKPYVSYRNHTFFVRNMDLIAQHGFMIALVDAPSDMPNGMGGVYRLSDGHREDFDPIISFLKEKADIPVWVMSMGAGTMSAVNMAINRKEELQGAVFLGAMTNYPYRWKGINKIYRNGLIDAADEIRVTTLIVHHKRDKCKYTQPRKIRYIGPHMQNSPKWDLLFFDGGCEPELTDCDQLSPHGFYCIDEIVVENIAGFIKSN